MNWLALDTSTDTLSIAVARGDRVWSHSSAGGAQASADGLPTAQRLMQEAGLAWRELTAIVMGRGPGAFTGLRTACAMAQGLAWGADLPVLPIDTLLAVAEEAYSTASDLPGRERMLTVMDARMSQVYVAAYERHDNTWQCVQAPALQQPTELHAPIAWQDQPYAAAGNAWATYADQWPASLQAPRLTAMPTATALLRLAPQAWAQGWAVPPEQALPLYVRDKVAQTTAERLQHTAPAA
jgi:tRNA threonylcarbamoyladenosine biosynthesis protein TsaB